MRELLAFRDFRLLVVGQAFSIFGDTAMFLVLGMWAKSLTGSNGTAGWVIFAIVAPSLLAPLAGLLVDRLPRRRVMIATDLLTAVVVLTLMRVTTRDDLWLVFVVAFAYGTSQLVFQSARLALVQGMLPDELLGQANGLLTTIRETMRLVGPLVGAAIFAVVGGGAVAVIDAVTFVLSAAALLAMRGPDPRPLRTEHHWLVEATAGIRHLLTEPILRRLVLTCVIALLAVGFFESVVFAVVEGLGKPVAFLAVLSTAQGVGAVLAGVSITAVVRRTGELRIVPVSLAVCAIGLALTAGATVAAVLIGMFLFGTALPPLVVALNTSMQRRSATELQGRVAAGFELLTSVPYALSIAVGAVLVGIVDFRILIAVMAVVVALSAVYALVTVREPRPA
jgi:MFS family permease